jgi:PiT family inorganic phosphate transporter
MSFDICPMNSRQGFGANLVTALMVTVASRFGLPVSTTHVSVGSLFGLGVATRGLVRSTASRVLLAWLVTVPAAGLAAGLVYQIVS